METSIPDSDQEPLLEIEDDPGLGPGRARSKTHITMLAIAISVILMAFLLRVRDDQRVEFVFLPELPMPETCVSKVAWNRECPGCGMTRSFIYLAQARLTESFAVNRTGWILALLTVSQIPYRLYRLRENRIRPQAPVGDWPVQVLWCVLVVMIGHWFLSLFGI